MFSGCAPQETPGRRSEVPPLQQQQQQQADQAMERLTADWAYQQGVNYFNQGNYEDAIRHFQLAIERDAMHLRAYLSLGDVYSMQQKFLLAETYYNKVLKYDPQSIPAYTALGNMNTSMGNYREAMSFYRKVLELEPSNQFVQQQLQKVLTDLFNWHYEQGMAYKEAGDIDQALIEFQKAQALSPDDIEFAVEIGNLFLQQQDYVMADGYFQQVLASNPNYLPAIIGAGKVQRALNHYNEAINYFKAGLDVQPGNPEAGSLLSQAQSEKVQRSLPPQYSAIAAAEQVTRGDVAALLMVDLMLENRLPSPPRVAIISDITTHWAKAYIIKAVQFHLMGLPPDRYFRPNEPIRKGELAFVLDTVFNALSRPLPQGSSVGFSDVHPQNLYHNAVVRVYSAGIIHAETDKTFGVVNSVSGQEAKDIFERVKSMIP